MTLSDFIEELNIAIRQDGHDIYCNASTAEIIKRCLTKQKEGKWIKQDCGGGDYQWDDNHGRLIRCKDCKYYLSGSDGAPFCFKHDDDVLWQDDDFCSKAELRGK